MSALKLSAADIDSMSDVDLYNTLRSYGVNVGPIVATTREIYKKKLIEKVESKSETTIPGLNSSFRQDTVSHDQQNVAGKSRRSIERPDSSHPYGDVNIRRDFLDKSYSSLPTAAGDHDSVEEDDFELQEEDRYESHSPPKPTTSFSSYSRQSYGSYDSGRSGSYDAGRSGVGLGQSRLSDYGRPVGESLHSDFIETREKVGDYRRSYAGPSTLGSSSRPSFGESASARADKILEDIRRRSVLSSEYRPISDADRYSRTRDILEQARQSGRISKSQTYGAKKSIFQEYLLKVCIGIVLFLFIYFVITSMTQSNSLKSIDQEISDILKESEKLDA